MPPIAAGGEDMPPIHTWDRGLAVTQETEYQYLEIVGQSTDFVDRGPPLSYHGSMARLSRIVVPGYPHLVTQRGVRSMDA